jgi:hypothetical protein
MKTLLGLMALLVALQDPRSACGQGIFGLTAPRPGDLPVAPGKGITDRHNAGSLWYSYASRARAGGYIINPHGSYSLTRVTLLYLSPPAPAASQPVVILPPAQPNHAENREAERVPPPRRPEVEAPIGDEALAPGAPASVFRPIRPEDRARAAVPAVPEPIRPDQPAAPSVPEQPLPVPLWPEPSPFPGPPAAAAEPKTASAQHIAFGKEAFQSRQYGRAERNFRAAMEKCPEDPFASFLLAQAQLALGKYAEAVAAIHAGMRLRPDWPSAAFRPRALYGTNPDDFSAHLQRLAEALANHPDDPFLAFLYAYQLWFDNRRDEARTLFQRAKALAPDPSFIERFLQAKAGSPVDHVAVELLPPGPRF